MPDIVIPKTYQDGDPLFEADLDNFRDSITTFLNDTKIDSDNIQDSGIETAKLQDSSVVTAKLDDNAVTTVKITDGDVTKAKLAADALAFLVPTGTILPYGGTAAPAGFLLCDGAEVDRTTYADLFGVLASSFGDGDTSTTFHLPDFRGRFMRGVDDGEGNDPDAGTRGAMNAGGNTGDNVGSLQGDTTRNHEHLITDHRHSSGDYIAEFIYDAGAGKINYDSRSATVSWTPDSALALPGASVATSLGGSTHPGIDVQGFGGFMETALDTGTMKDQTGESRPKNGYVNYIIKI